MYEDDLIIAWKDRRAEALRQADELRRKAAELDAIARTLDRCIDDYRAKREKDQT